MKKDIIPLIIIVLTSIIISLPFMVPGFFTVHDDQQIARLFLFDKALKSGQFPPRWVDQLGFGFGYPLFIFYPPLVYFLGETFHILGFGFIDSIKLVFATSVIFSGIAMYILTKEFWGRSAGIVSGIFYMLAPYRALDIYIRGALAESFTFVWLPLILWSFYKLTKTFNNRYIYLSSILLAFLMITHNLIFLPFMLILPIYLLFLTLICEKKKKFIVYYIPASFISALSLSAFFWLPSLMEKKFTIVDNLLLVNLANYNIHFVYLQQLWNWPWGFGGSAEGLTDGISFKIGKLHTILSFVSLIIAIIFIILGKKKNEKFFSGGLHIFSFFIIFAFSAFMTTFYSKFLWNLITPLAYLQFPWRFLVFNVLSASILSGAFIFLVRVPILKLLAGIILVTLLLATNLKLFKPQTYREELTDQTATAREEINWRISQSSFEYVPKGLELYKSNLGTNIVKIDKRDIPQSRLEIISETGQIEIISSTPSKTEFRTASPQQISIKANIFNFPGWRVIIDNEAVLINDHNNFKLIAFEVPEGNHFVSIEFKNTPIRTLANTISLISILSMFILITKRWKTNSF